MKLQGSTAKVACLFDIHGNLPALEAVFAEVRATGVDRIVIGGDVLPGPMPRECLDLLFGLDTPVSFIIGNGDREAAVASRGEVSSVIPEFFREAMRWNAAQLTANDVERINQWPLTTQLTVDGIGEVLFCHATPRNDMEIFVKTTADDKLRPIFDSLGVQLVVCGHTHMQFDRVVGSTRIINAGSVGMPFQDAGAYWALVGSGIELRTTRYDLDAAARVIRGTGYPQSDAFATTSILNPPNEQSMIEAFAKAELR